MSYSYCMKIVCVILCFPFLGFCLTGYGRICSPCLLTQMIHVLLPGHDDGHCHEGICFQLGHHGSEEEHGPVDIHCHDHEGGCFQLGHHGCNEEHSPVDIHCCVYSLALLLIDAEPAEKNSSLKKKAFSFIETGAEAFQGTGESTGPPGRGLLPQLQGSRCPPATGIPAFILHSQLLI